MSEIHKSSPPSELELQSYLDNELSPAERERVFLWLTNNPDSLRAILDQRSQENQLRSTILKSGDTHGSYHEQLMRDVDDIASNNRRIAWILFGFIAGIMVTGFIIFLLIS